MNLKCTRIVKLFHEFTHKNLTIRIRPQTLIQLGEIKSFNDLIKHENKTVKIVITEECEEDHIKEMNDLINEANTENLTLRLENIDLSSINTCFVSQFDIIKFSSVTIPHGYLSSVTDIESKRLEFHRCIISENNLLSILSAKFHRFCYCRILDNPSIPQRFQLIYHEDQTVCECTRLMFDGVVTEEQLLKVQEINPQSIEFSSVDLSQFDNLMLTNKVVIFNDIILSDDVQVRSCDKLVFANMKIDDKLISRFINHSEFFRFFKCDLSEMSIELPEDDYVKIKCALEQIH